MKWPGVLPAGAKYSAPVGHVDIFATAAAAAGAALPTDRKLDGVNLLPFVEGKEAPDARPHKTLFFRSGDYKTLLSGDWKLQVSERPKKNWLFNLKDDPTEKVNLADAQPEKLQELMAELEAQNAEQAKPLWPVLAEGPVAIDHPEDPDRFPDSPDDEYIYWAN
jgi:arylsulfatase A-like enzyme